MRGAVTLFWGKFQTLLSSKPHFCFAEYHFLSQVFNLCHPQQKAKHLPVLTNPVYHLWFYFLNNCKFLNLDLDWKIWFASFVVQIHMAERLNFQPHQAVRAPSIHSAPSLPSPLPMMTLWPLQGAAQSVLRYSCIQLTLNSVLAFGDIHVHGSKIKTTFLKSVCSTYSLLHGFHAEVGDKLHLKRFPYLLSSFEGKGMKQESAILNFFSCFLLCSSMRGSNASNLSGKEYHILNLLYSTYLLWTNTLTISDNGEIQISLLQLFIKGFLSASNFLYPSNMLSFISWI